MIQNENAEAKVCNLTIGAIKKKWCARKSGLYTAQKSHECHMITPGCAEVTEKVGNGKQVGWLLRGLHSTMDCYVHINCIGTSQSPCDEIIPS